VHRGQQYRTHLDVGARFLVIWWPCSSSGSCGELLVWLHMARSHADIKRDTRHVVGFIEAQHLEHSKVPSWKRDSLSANALVRRT
jgi:hypothetical protein